MDLFGLIMNQALAMMKAMIITFWKIMQYPKVNWDNDPEEEYEHWATVFSEAISLGDSETIKQLKKLLPELAERF